MAVFWGGWGRLECIPSAPICMQACEEDPRWKRRVWSDGDTARGRR